MERTILALSMRCIGQELHVASALVDLIDEYIYCDNRTIAFDHNATPTARRIASALNNGGNPGDLLRAALKGCGGPGNLLVGLLEVILTNNSAWEPTATHS